MGLEKTDAAARAAPGSICIVRLSALGDVVMVAPLINMIRREWPGASITWIIGRGAYPAVASLEGRGVEFVVIDKPRGPGDYLALRRRLAGRVFDALLCLQASWRANFVYPCVRAYRKIGYGGARARDCHGLFVRERVPAGAGTHIVDGFLGFGEALGGARSGVDYEGAWGLGAKPGALAWAEATLPRGRWLAVAPCASKAERDWPAAGYAEVISRVWRAHGLPAVLFGGAAERERAMAEAICERVARLEPGCPVMKLTGATSVAQLVAALSRCAALLAVDTGAVHIARAFGRPVAGLYAVAPAARTGPYGRLDFCVDKFSEAVALVHGRARAGGAGGSGGSNDAGDAQLRVHDSRAMALITADEVAARLERALAAG